MKTKTILITLIAMLAVTALVFQSCKKDEKEDPTPPIYTNGQGEIGEIGGTVKIEDPSSPINGASIVIPEGALNTEKEISITYDPNQRCVFDSTAIIVKFEPAGLTFNEQVEIGIPFESSVDTSDLKVFYYDKENESFHQMTITGINVTNRIITASTNHFSGFFSTTKYTRIYTELVKVDNTLGALVEITSVKYGQDEKFGLIYTLPLVWSGTGYWNAKQIINEHQGQEVLSLFNVTLKRKITLGRDEVIQSKELIIRRIEHSYGTHGYEVYENYISTSNLLYTEETGEDDQIFETFMQGIPLIFKFDKDGFVPDNSHKYYVNIKWALATDPSGYYVARYTHLYEEDNRKEAKKPTVMNDWDKDINPVDNVNDNYQSGSGGNNPPSDPTNPTPSNNATNISVNTNLSWTCTDPEGDALDYDIYFGTSSNPPMVTDHHTSTTYDPSTLEENTTYYWQIKAFEVGNEDNQSASPVWHFTTDSGGGNDTENPVTYFIDPVSGETVSGNYPVIVRATDNVGIERVEIQVKENGVYQLECTIYEPYNNDDYSCNWNTGNYSNGNHWIFVAAYDYAGNAGSTAIEVTVNNIGTNTPPIALFTVSPSNGTTSTNFAFDASGSTDNEDPTSNLQVRWDFDGNGSWDTGWDYDKTEDHQYSSENTYTAKLEVKDTEGLTDQYTKSITVSNGGGNGCGGQANLTYGGQTYEIVEIGNQCWMAENLNYETTNSWWYDNSSANGNVYGRLYTWEAALTACPSGWSLPSDDQWKQMEMALGMSQSEADDTGWRGTDEGGKMKETGTTHWNSPNTGATNTSGFTALPGGLHNSNGSFYSLGSYGTWWSSSEYSGARAWVRRLGYGYDQVYRFNSNKAYGFSVRCLKN